MLSIKAYSVPVTTVNQFYGSSQKVQMSYVANGKEQHLQGRSQLRSIAHITQGQNPKIVLNMDKGQCNLKVFIIGICNGFP
jgi:hypothetical protein